MDILKYILFLFVLIPFGCVDITTIPNLENDQKIFVFCEIEANKRTIADIYYLGDVNGNKIRQLNSGDTNSFSLVEGEKDWGYPFEYHRRDSVFYIDADKFEIKSGLTYRFLGIGQTLNGVEPKIQVPMQIEIETFKVLTKKVKYENGLIVTELKCSLTLPSSQIKNSFFHIIPKGEGDLRWDINVFENNVQAFSLMNHKPGFLVDFSKMKDDDIQLQLSITAVDTAEVILFDLYHVTESYYRYNQYASNIVSSGNNFIANPPIAGFNIYTDKAYGTFMAKTLTTSVYEIK